MNWDHVNILLSVIHQAAAAGPKFQKYAAMAADELEALWVEAEAPADEESATVERRI